MKKDTRTVLEFIIVFITIVFIECADIQLKLDNRRIIKKDKIVGHALVVSENKITEYVANAQIVNGTSAIVANAVVTKEDIEKAKNEKKEEQSIVIGKNKKKKKMIDIDVQTGFYTYTKQEQSFIPMYVAGSKK